MSIPHPYGRDIFHGRLLDHATIAALRHCEHELGYELTITQGIGGATASAGSHTEGRAVDLAEWDHARKVRVLRDFGFAAWYRPELPGVWGPHIHAVLIFDGRDNRKGIAPVAFDQIGKYDRGEDGLANPPTPDPDPYRPDPKRGFSMREYERSFALPEPKPTNVSKARDAIVEALHASWQAEALLKDAAGRPLAQSQIDDLQAARKQIKAVLEKLPPR